jgi:hypothetical protein
MKTFLGLSLTSKPLTDSEVVERARKRIQRSRRYGKWLALLFEVAMVTAMACLAGFMSWAINFLIPNQAVGDLAGGILIGFLCGGLFVYFIQRLRHAIWVLQGDRNSELLVKYHDALIELARSKSPPAAPLEAGQGRAGQGGGKMMNAD